MKEKTTFFFNSCLDLLVTQKVDQWLANSLNFFFFYFLMINLMYMLFLHTRFVWKAQSKHQIHSSVYLRTQTELLLQTSKWDKFSNRCCSEHSQTFKTLPLWLQFHRNEKRVSCLNAEGKNLQHFLSGSTLHHLSKARGRNLWAKKRLSRPPQRL